MRRATINQRLLRAVLWCCLLLISNPIYADEATPERRPGMMRGGPGQRRPGMGRPGPGMGGPGMRHPGMGGPGQGPGGEQSELGRFGHNAPQMMQAARERMMKMSPEERAQFRERHKQARAQRREAKVSSMRTRWGPALKDPALQAELRLNAERMAKLHRMQALAEDNGKNEVLDRVFALMKREQQRHMRAMSQAQGSHQQRSGAKGHTRMPDNPGAPPQGTPPAEPAPKEPATP